MSDSDLGRALVLLAIEHKEGRLTPEQYAAAVKNLSADGEEFSEGFTGTVTDTRGRKIHYVDGKRVSGQQQRKEKRSARAAEPTSVDPAKVPADVKRGVITRLAVGAVKAGIAVKDVTTRLGRSAWKKLSEPEQKLAKDLWVGAQVLHHRLDAPRHAAEQLCTEVAKERGLNEIQVKSVASTLAVAKGIEQWLTNIPYAHAVAHHAGVEGPEAFAVAKVGALVPVAAMAYLAYSTAVNPFAMIRAARNLLKGKAHPAHEDESSADDRELAGRLLELADNYGEWGLAVVSVALDQTRDLEQAIDQAEQLLPHNPDSPDDADEQLSSQDLEGWA